MAEDSSRMSDADAGDALPEFTFLSLFSNSRNKSSSDVSNVRHVKEEDMDSIDARSDANEKGDDVLFMGTNIRVKCDMNEPSDLGGDTKDSVHTESQSDCYDTGEAGSSFGTSGDTPSVDLTGSCNIDDYAGRTSQGNVNTGGDNYDTSPAKDEITAVPRVSHEGGNSNQTGFLLNFFRGRGSKATLKSVVKGKTVYNKIIDLDADSGTPCEFEDVNDAIQHVTSARSAHPKVESLSSVSNVSGSSNRRHRTYRNEQGYLRDYHDHRPRSDQTIIGLGRIDPYHMGRLDHFDESGTGRTINGEKQCMTPDLFNGWVRAFFNVTVTTVLLYLGMVFILAISRDISNGLEKRRQMVKAEAMLCQELYRKNKCRTMKVPALEGQCRQWEACMYKDAILYDDASFLSAEVLGGVINKFVSQLDARTVGIVLATFLALFVGSNCALSMSSSSRVPSPGWFRGWFSRNSQPPSGSDLLQNTQFLPNPQLLHAMRNPYLQPNYCVMGSYPYVNTGAYYHPHNTESLSYYHDKQTDDPGHSVRGGRTNAWKRRFMSPWVDQQ